VNEDDRFWTPSVPLLSPSRNTSSGIHLNPSRPLCIVGPNAQMLGDKTTSQ
jgi:hypothetical protein